MGQYISIFNNSQIEPPKHEIAITIKLDNEYITHMEMDIKDFHISYDFGNTLFKVVQERLVAIILLGKCSVGAKEFIDRRWTCNHFY